jgi:CDP-glucose 4,6-dehydratase
MITGHTGFKGTWLTLMLMELGIDVVGYSLPPQKNSIYNLIGLAGTVPEVFEDIRSDRALSAFIEKYQPSGIVHLAAQPLVIESYKDPKETFEINVMGTANLLEIARKSSNLESIVVSTTDKVYRNKETGRKFVENDPLEGIDPYSASKVAAEAVIKSWQNIYRSEGNIRLIAARSGNVIGGGDLAENRLIPDCIRSHLHDQPLSVRNPDSIRPWQHVLEPLFGYFLALGFGSYPAYNFGPSEVQNLTVLEVVQVLKQKIPLNYEVSMDEKPHYESHLLSLDSTLAKESLGWLPVFGQSDAILKTTEWWDVYLKGGDPLQKTKNQIQDYVSERCATASATSSDLRL